MHVEVGRQIGLEVEGLTIVVADVHPHLLADGHPARPAGGEILTPLRAILDGLQRAQGFDHLAMGNAAKGDGAAPHFEKTALAIELHRLLTGVHHQPFHLLAAGQLLEILHHSGTQPLAAIFGTQRHKADLRLVTADKETPHRDGGAIGCQHQPVNGNRVVFIPLGTDGQIEGLTQKFPAQLVIGIQLGGCLRGDYPIHSFILEFAPTGRWKGLHRRFQRSLQ